MQSSRSDVPEIDPIRTFPEFMQGISSPAESLLLLPWEEGTTPIRKVLGAGSAVREIVVLIGPEGGFSAKEADQAREHGFHAEPGPNILRTETAALAVLAMIMYEYSFISGSPQP